MTTVRDERAAALVRRHRDLSDDFTRAMPLLLDDLEAIDAAHAEDDAYEPGSVDIGSGERDVTEIFVPPAPTADAKAAPGTAEFDERTAEIRARGFGFEADARDRLAAETRGAAPVKPAPRRRTTR